MKQLTLLAGLVMLLALTAACGGDAPQARVTATIAPTITTAPATPTAEATTLPDETPPPAGPVPTATAEQGAGVLPAPLYYLTGESGEQLQIWRVEADGESTTQITSEPEGVTEFDVLPTDGSLVYVTGDDLVMSDSMGGERTVLFTAPPIPDEENPYAIQSGLAEPRVSPDGEKIAFRYRGIHLMEMSTGSVEPLLEDDPVPTDERPTSRLHFYRVNSWSPEGQRLLVNVAYFMEGGEPAIYSFDSGELLYLQPGEDGQTPCCTSSWLPDGQSVIFAQDLPSVVPAGMWHIDATTGQVRSLLPVDAQSGIPAVPLLHPRVTAGGDLYGWVRDVPEGADQMQAFSAPFYISRAPLESAGDPSAWEIVNNEPLRPIEVLWAGDDSGALISVEEGRGWLPTGNTLVWVPADGTDIVPLPVAGKTLRWGTQ